MKRSLNKWNGQDLNDLSKPDLIRIIKEMARLHEEILQQKRYKAAFDAAVQRNEG